MGIRFLTDGKVLPSYPRFNATSPLRVIMSRKQFPHVCLTSRIVSHPLRNPLFVPFPCSLAILNRIVALVSFSVRLRAEM